MRAIDTLDNTILPDNTMLEYIPGNDTITSSKSVILEETMREFDHILEDQDKEDPAVIAHHIEDETLASVI